MLRFVKTVFLTSLMMLCTAVPAFAAVNPATGDESGTKVSVMIALLAVSAVLIVAYVIFTLKKKK